ALSMCVVSCIQSNRKRWTDFLFYFSTSFFSHVQFPNARISKIATVALLGWAVFAQFVFIFYSGALTDMLRPKVSDPHALLGHGLNYIITLAVKEPYMQPGCNPHGVFQLYGPGASSFADVKYLIWITSNEGLRVELASSPVKYDLYNLPTSGFYLNKAFWDGIFLLNFFHGVVRTEHRESFLQAQKIF